PLRMAAQAAEISENDEESARKRASDGPVALRPLAVELPGAAHSGSLLTRLLFRGLLEKATHLHFPINPFTLKLFLQRAQRLIDVVVANQHLHTDLVSLS